MKRKTTITLMILMLIIALCGCSSKSANTIQLWDPAEEQAQAALEILQKQLYSDFMALSMEELTGGSLTNVAIETAMLNLNLKADRYEWQCFAFVQKVLRLLGIETEEIKFKRQTISNRSEMVSDISLMRDYIDQETALKINPYIDQEEIPEILNRLAAESMSAAPVVQEEPTETEEDDA